MGSRSRQHRPCAESTVQHGIIAVGTTTDDVEAGWSGIYVQASQAEGVIMVPNGRGAVFIRILENSESWSPGGAEICSGFVLKEVVPGAFRGIAARDVVSSGKIPGFGVAIGFVADTNCAVNNWCDVPRRTLSVKKQIDGSLLKVTYTDTLGSYATQYQACNWRILVDDAVVSFFSDADETRASGVAWTMSHASHVALAPGVASGEHVVKVQVLRQPGATECLMGWNTHGGGAQASGHLLVEEVP